MGKPVKDMPNRILTGKEAAKEIKRINSYIDSLSENVKNAEKAISDIKGAEYQMEQIAQKTATFDVFKRNVEKIKQQLQDTHIKAKIEKETKKGINKKQEEK